VVHQPALPLPGVVHAVHAGCVDGPRGMTEPLASLMALNSIALLYQHMSILPVCIVLIRFVARKPKPTARSTVRPWSEPHTHIFSCQS